MLFSYHQVKEHPKLLLATTGLSHTEFAQLLRHFQYAWDQYRQKIILIETIANVNMAQGDQSRLSSILRTSFSSFYIMSKYIPSLRIIDTCLKNAYKIKGLYMANRVSMYTHMFYIKRGLLL
jgi:hypothetical protein